MPSCCNGMSSSRRLRRCTAACSRWPLIIPARCTTPACSRINRAGATRRSRNAGQLTSPQGSAGPTPSRKRRAAKNGALIRSNQGAPTLSRSPLIASATSGYSVPNRIAKARPLNRRLFRRNADSRLTRAGGGPLPVLWQPNELVVIGGAAAGSLMISAPGRGMKRVIAAFKRGFKDSSPTKADYRELLKMLYQILALIRREGVLALESHISERASSTIFQAYPSVTKRHHAMDFLVDGLKQLVDGCSAEELAMLFDAELETHHDEEHAPINLIRNTGDALPGLGIVAAVLGIVITMGHMDGGPEVIGHHVAAALVGTFLGILLCYGVMAPIATSIELQAQAETRFLMAIREGVLCAARGNAPELSVEFARRVIFSDERPSSKDMPKLLAAAKG